MGPPFIDSGRLSRLLSMEDAIDALEEAFGGELPEAPPRSHLDVGSGDLLVMPAWAANAAGVKLVTIAPDNPARELPLIHGIYALFDKPALRPVALFDAAPLTALRTAAVSGVATRHLARTDAEKLVIFGAGSQARAHLDAMGAVRPITHVTIVSRNQARAEELAKLGRGLGFDGRVGTAAAVAEADIVCTCTTSTEPVLDGTLLRPGAHVNAVGSYKAAARELDDAALRGATSIAVDTETASSESGDLVIPLEAGVIAQRDVRLLSEAAATGGRSSDSDITIFKSVGAAFEDLVVALAAASRL